MPEFQGKLPTVIVVEDDPHGLSFMESSLDVSGYRVLKATSAEDAIDIIRQTEPQNLVAAISDYRLPGASGLDLLKTIRDMDASLAVIIITGQGEKTIVEKAMNLGAQAYIEKPVTHQQLRDRMMDAVAETRSQRQSVRDRKGLEDLEKFDMRVRGIVPAHLENNIRIVYKPLHEIGGDFFISHRYSPEEDVIVIGDVSGHDITSGFVSIYFQGVFRGCMENSSKVQEFLKLSNQTLHDRTMRQLQQSEIVSLSIAAFYSNSSNKLRCHWNYGLPPTYGATPYGGIIEFPFGNPPLGWLNDLNVDAVKISHEQVTKVYAFTDGILDYALDLEVSTLSLFYRLLQDQNVINDLPIEPRDDILGIEYFFNPEVPLNQNYQPILSEHYAGTEVEHIDQLQSNWRRSLNFAMEDQLGDRLYDLLICIREGMLNALVHGCQKAPDKFAHLQISMNSEKTALRVIIDDPGRGHEFDLKKRLQEIGAQTGKHLGLGLIQHLSDDFRIDNKGTSLIFDFEINPVKSHS